MVRTEVITKKMATVLGKQSNGMQFSPKRSEGKVLSGWLPVVRIEAETPDKFQLTWNIKYAAEFRIAKEAAEIALRELCKDPSDVQWG